MRGFILAASLVLFGFSSGFSQESPGQRADLEKPGRRPVVLVPGWLGHAQDLGPLKDRLVRDGWSEEAVLPLEFDDPVGSSLVHARELDEAIQQLLSETGAADLDIVAHSMGGLAVWVLLQEKGSLLPVHRVVFLATPFHGTVTAYLAWGEGGPEMIPGSQFLADRRQGGWPQRWVDALAIRTPLDLTVVPSYQATLQEAGDLVICCPTHQGLLDHEETYLAIREFLLEGKAPEPSGSPWK